MFPTWVALRNLPFEHHDQALAIAETLGEVIGIDTANENTKDPRFCVNLNINKGWVTNINLESKEGIFLAQKVQEDHDKLPIRCRAYQSWTHKVSNCKEIQKQTNEGGREDRHVLNIHNNKKGKKCCYRSRWFSTG